MSKNNAYPPKIRSFYKPETFKIESFSPKKNHNSIIDSKTNHIVCNNISYSEFDYTEDPFDLNTYK